MKPVILAGTEDDVDVLIARGYVATTSPAGARNWREGYNRPLAKRDVVIVPRNDAQGRAFARKVEDALRRDARSVRRVDLDDVPDGVASATSLLPTILRTSCSRERLKRMVHARAVSPSGHLESRHKPMAPSTMWSRLSPLSQRSCRGPNPTTSCARRQRARPGRGRDRQFGAVKPGAERAMTARQARSGQ
jgi:hypothetical protein